MIGATGLIASLSAVLCTLAPSPDATDKVGAVAKLVIACGVLVGSGVILYAVAEPHRRRQLIG